MNEVSVHEAKTHLSRLLRKVEAGEEVTICRGGTPVARLVPTRETRSARVLGLDRALFSVPEDFDAPLPDEIRQGFEGA